MARVAMCLYLDSAPIIYFVECSPSLRETMLNRLSGTRTGMDIIVVSHLSRLECRVKPLRENNRSLLDRYDQFFEAEGVEVVPTDGTVWDLATELRARHNLRVPDALHLASATVHRCDRFLTNDHRLDHIPGISTELCVP